MVIILLILASMEAELAHCLERSCAVYRVIVSDYMQVQTTPLVPLMVSVLLYFGWS